jgi:hypothetical protein
VIHITKKKKKRIKYMIACSSIKYITLSDRFDFAVKFTTLIHKHESQVSKFQIQSRMHLLAQERLS